MTGAPSSPISRARALAALAAPAMLAATPPPLPEAVPLRVATATSDSYGQAFYALDGGFFEKFGLSVTLQIFGNGAQALTSAVSGNADIAITNPVSLVQAAQHGVPITCFAGSCYYTSSAPTTALFVADDAPYRSAKDLEGKIVGLLSVKDFSIAALDEWLTRNGADPASVKSIEIPGPEMAVALKRGTIAAASIPEPFIAAARGDVRLLGKHFDLIARKFFIDIWTAPPALLQKSPAVVKRFAAAIYATAKWANTHHEETAAILARYAKMEPELIRRMTRATYAEFFDVAALQPAFDAAYKYKIIPTPAKMAEVVTRLE